MSVSENFPTYFYMQHILHVSCNHSRYMLVMCSRLEVLHETGSSCNIILACLHGDTCCITRVMQQLLPCNCNFHHVDDSTDGHYMPITLICCLIAMREYM